MERGEHVIPIGSITKLFYPGPRNFQELKRKLEEEMAVVLPQQCFRMASLIIERMDYV